MKEPCQELCPNDILIALVRYITPQDCIINSTLDNYHSTHKTQLSQKRNITCCYDVMQQWKAQEPFEDPTGS